MEKLKDNIWVLVFAMVFNVLGLMAYGAITKHKNAASVEYVNKENIKQDNICKGSAMHFETAMDLKADKDYVDANIEALKESTIYQRKKLDTMYEILIEWKTNNP